MMGSPSPSTPLRDRLLSNSPTADGHGWIQQQATSSSHSSAVSPLRIAKRDTPTRKLYPTQLARRSSSSYNHVKNNNLVSKSPFRSNIPTPAKTTPTQPATSIPRRVSGEKRPRPQSMHEQAENEHPIGFKRRQSKGLQGLFQKEPVTNSPFRRVPEPGDSPPPPTVPPKPRLSNISPARPSLVTKRFHGPRTVGLTFANNKRQRRKTVTFDERCDVVEFDRDEHEMDEEDQHMYEYGKDEDEYEEDEELVDEDDFDEDFYNPNTDDSITGLVDSMLQDTQGVDDRPHTPPHESSIPAGVETEDGVPLGRTHHADRLAVYHEEQRVHHENDDEEPPRPERSYIYSSASTSPATPSRFRTLSPSLTNISPGSHLPLGRTTHSERAIAGHRPDELEEDLQMLPLSPSLSKKVSKLETSYRDGLIPSFGLKVKGEPAGTGADPFAPGPVEDHQPDTSLQGSFESVELADHPDRHPDSQLDTVVECPEDRPPSSTSLTRRQTSSREGSPASIVPPRKHSTDICSRSNSPLSRSSSPFFAVRNSSVSSLDSNGSLTRSRGPRISKEDVQHRLLKKRSMDSPLREVMSSETDTRRDRDSVVENANPSGQMDFDGPPLNSMFSRRSSAEALQTSTDVSTDIESKDVVIEKVEKRKVVSMKRENNMTHDSAFPTEHGTPPSLPDVRQRAHTIGAFEGLKFDLGSDMGFGGMEMDHLGDMRSALDRLVQDVADSGNAASRGAGAGLGLLKIEAVTKGVKAGTFMLPTNPLDENTATDTEDEKWKTRLGASVAGKRPERADSALLGTGFTGSSPERDVGISSAPTAVVVPPIPPTKDAIKTREKIIMEKRREMKRQEEEEAMGFITPPRHANRPSRRRSLSTGDAEDLLSKKSAAKRRTAALKSNAEDGVLDVKPFIAGEDPLSDSIDRELRKMEGPNRGRYHVREHETTIYASSDADQVSHMASAGDVNSGKAWRTVRRPSDMDEYAKQIKEYRSQQRPGKVHGKLFVKVLGLKGINVPLPQQSTAISCTLNNGIHFVTTPECQLGRDCRIDQEFELIEHSKLEFTLTFKVKRDPHIVAQFKANAAPPPPPPSRMATPPPSKGSRFNFFGSPKKSAKASPKLPPAPPPNRVLEENLARYLKPDGTLARAFISYKDITGHCDTRLFETSYPLIGQRLEEGNTVRTTQVGEIVLQMFRLPPLPGVPPQQLPQSLEECHRGLRHVSWHKVTYFEGTLTQNGGDCTTWRRRHLRVTGANLVAYNDVTKKAIATIDLKKAEAVEDDQEPRNNMLSPASNTTSRTRYNDEFDGPYGVERSFRLIFPNDQQIVFFSDTDDEKSRWLEVLRALIGRIPPNPLWAELLWQRQEELAKQGPRTTASTSLPSQSQGS